MFKKIMLAIMCIFILASCGCASVRREPSNETYVLRNINDSEAKRIALKEAGVREKDAYMVGCGLFTVNGTDHHKHYWDIQFIYDDGKEGIPYHYEIDAATGKILHFEHEVEDYDGMSLEVIKKLYED